MPEHTCIYIYAFVFAAQMFASDLRLCCSHSFQVELLEKQAEQQRALDEAKDGRRGEWKFLLWMDEILHHSEALGSYLFVGIDRGIIILGLLRWCRISSTHSMGVFFWGNWLAVGLKGNQQEITIQSQSKSWRCSFDPAVELSMGGCEVPPVRGLLLGSASGEQGEPLPNCNW